MLPSEIASLRLNNQKLSGSAFKNPDEVVKWMGAVQAQDYAGAKWAVGQRMQNGTDAAIEKAIAKGSILRTHVLRPTWHFVTPKDIRWMIALTAPRIKAYSAGRRRQLGLTSAILARCNDALAKALQGKQLTRQETMEALQEAGIDTGEQRFVHILMEAELDMVICNGAKKDKQFTYALFDDRVPATKPLTYEEALAKLTLRYFTSHGPATAQDFGWWSGLAIVDIKKGLEEVKTKLNNEIIDGNTYWMPENKTIIKNQKNDVYLLPAFDEYTVSYKDRSAALDAVHIPHTSHGLKPAIIIDGGIAGTWKPVLKKNTISIETNPLIPFTKAHHKAIEAAGDRYKEFLGR